MISFRCRECNKLLGKVRQPYKEDSKSADIETVCPKCKTKNSISFK